MANIILTGSDETTREEAEATSRHYTPGPQEEIEETPEEVDRSPLTDVERESIDKASQDTFQPILHDQPRDRATTFQPPSKWESPAAKYRRSQAMMFASARALDDLEERITTLTRFPGAPEAVQIAEAKAREALATARQARADGAHPDNPKYARDTAAKDLAALKAAEAVRAVSDFERTARDHQDEWFDGMVADLDRQRVEAAEALEKAAKAYSAWRQSIAAADSMAREQGRFGEWHHHPQERELNPLRLVGEIRKARDIAKSDDDWINGTYLTAEYDGVPPHTLAALERSAEVAGGGSYAEQVLLRLKSPHTADTPVQDAIASKDLRIIHTSPIPSLLPERPQD